MKSRYEDFIGIFDDVFPQGYCEHLIKEFERLKNEGAGSSRQQFEKFPRHQKDDFHIFLPNYDLYDFEDNKPKTIFFDGLQPAFDNYVENFSILKNFSLNTNDMKMQKTSAGQGYHVFHSETMNLETAPRILVFMLYLNSLEPADGGETEFLYQKSRFSPKQNQLLIWPSSFTHTHRGNLVLNNTKYVITGWFHLDK